VFWSSKLAHEFAAVIGKNITVVGGQIEGSDNLLIEGVVESKINLDAKLVVGAHGQVSGEIEAEQLEVQGTLDGNITVLKIATLSTASQVSGLLKSPRIVMEDGAVFSGRLEMGTGLEKGR
jgi:cytoskeletal protein CcmA (bactofilin family)